jgi:hypothetical protein
VGLSPPVPLLCRRTVRATRAGALVIELLALPAAGDYFAEGAGLMRTRRGRSSTLESTGRGCSKAGVVPANHAARGLGGDTRLMIDVPGIIAGLKAMLCQTQRDVAEMVAHHEVHLGS